MKSVKAKAIEAAEKALGPNSSAIVFGGFVRGYMAGHAAHTRWANKTMVRRPGHSTNPIDSRETYALGKSGV